jgi:hypothetical protein
VQLPSRSPSVDDGIHSIIDLSMDTEDEGSRMADGDSEVEFVESGDDVMHADNFIDLT